MKSFIVGLAALATPIGACVHDIGTTGRGEGITPVSPVSGGPVSGGPVSGGPVTATVTGESMGGSLRVTVRCPTTEEHPACMAAALEARAEVERIAALATDWSPEGEISRLNAAAGGDPLRVSPEVGELLALSRDVAEASGGAFDITINALWGLWDFRRGLIADPEALRARLPLVDWRDLELGPCDTSGCSARLARVGMSVTLGGIAQGYAATRALRRIPTAWEALVDVSGDLAARGCWTVGIQDPRKERGVVATELAVCDQALSTAGDYEQAFVQNGARYHHILDPKTGQPANGAWSATVLHPDGAVTDALDTALIVTGVNAQGLSLIQRFGAMAVIIDASGIRYVGPDGSVSP